MGKIMPAIMDLFPGYESVEILEMNAFTLCEPQTIHQVKFIPSNNEQQVLLRSATAPILEPIGQALSC